METFNKSKMITPLITLSAASIAVIIMYVRDYEFYKMLWCLLAVVIIFYIIGDIVQTIYIRIRPRVIPEEEALERLLAKKYYGISGVDFVDDDMLENYVDAARAERNYTDDEIRKLIASNKLGLDDDLDDEESQEVDEDISDNGLDENYEDNGSFMDENNI